MTPTVQNIVLLAKEADSQKKNLQYKILLENLYKRLNYNFSTTGFLVIIHDATTYIGVISRISRQSSPPVSFAAIFLKSNPDT